MDRPFHRLQMAELVFGTADAIVDSGDMLLESLDRLLVALQPHGLAQFVIQFGDSALKFAELRQVARGGTVLVELLGQFAKPTIHVGNGTHVRPLRDAGGKLFDGHAQCMDVALRSRRLLDVVDPLVEATNLASQPLQVDDRRLLRSDG